MENHGTVTGIDNEYIQVRIHRNSACGEGCAACGLCKNRDMTVTLKNDGSFSLGEEVRLVSDDKHFLKSSAVGYLLLTLLLILGGALGAHFGGEGLSFVLAFVFLFAGILALRRLSPKSIEIKAEKITR